jgi:hypothetical protein
MAEKIIYYCYGGAHSSVVTAAIYLGLLDKNKIPTASELMLVPFFDRQEQDDHGQARLMGQDQQENNVYIIGNRSLIGFEKLIDNFLDTAEVRTKPILVDTLSGVNFAMRVGGFLSRRLKLTVIGRPLVIMGTQKAYKNFSKIAENIEQKVLLAATEKEGKQT